MAKKRTSKCLHCKKTIIIRTEKHVVLQTKNISKKRKLHEAYFHFQCWADYFNERVMKKTESKVEDMKSLAYRIMELPGVKKALNDLPDPELIEKMLNNEMQLQDIVGDVDVNVEIKSSKDVDGRTDKRKTEPTDTKSQV